MNLAELHARLGETEVNLEMASRREDEQAARLDAQDAELKRLRELEAAVLGYEDFAEKVRRTGSAPGYARACKRKDAAIAACRAAKAAPEVKP